MKIRSSTAPGAPPRRYVHAQEVADFLSLFVWSVHDLARRGVIPRVRLGRAVRFDLEAVEAAVLKASA